MPLRPSPALRLAIAVVALLLPLGARADSDPALARSLGEPARGMAPALYARELELPDTLGVGRVAGDVARELPRVEALTDYLTAKAAELGYSRALPVLARDQDEMAEYLRKGLVDVVAEEPLAAMHDEAEAGASVLLGEQCAGHGDWHTVVFVRKDFPARSLHDLAEECLILPGGESGEAFLMPLADLRSAGLKLSRISGRSSEPAAGEAGYFLAPPGTSLAKSVSERVASAGAATNLDWDREEALGTTTNLRVLRTFDSLPRGLVVVGAGMSEPRRESLRRVLLEMPGDGEGVAALHRYGDVTGFRRIDDELAGGIARARALYALVHGEAR